jgi:hypothetical protein
MGGSIMLVYSDGYIPTKEEWDKYHEKYQKISKLQKFFLVIWPTTEYIQWKRYRKLKKEDCY